MATAFVLLLEDPTVGPALELIRRVCQPDSRSKPHITVRYPVDKVDLQAVHLYEETVIENVRIAEAGAFGLGPEPAGERCAVYLRCESDTLEALSYKPLYPDSVFHLTVYEGVDLGFGSQLLSLLASFPWGLIAPLPEDTRVRRIPIGRGARERRGWKSADKEMWELARLLELESLVERRDRLGPARGSDPLAVVRAVCKFLHSHLDRSENRLTPDRVGCLLRLPRRPHQMSLWSHSASEPRARRWESGVFLTPPELAAEAIACAMPHLKPGTAIRFGDPAIGSGILFAVLLRYLDGHPLQAATGVELDADRARLTNRRWAQRGLKILSGDFLTAKATERWNLVVANPPYVRSQDIDQDLARVWRENIREQRGVQLSGRASLYVYFLLMAHAWMESDCVAAWILPSDFLETAYGRAAREYLTTQVQLLRVHTYESAAPKFENALVASSLIVFKNRPPKPGVRVRLSHGLSVSAPAEEAEIPVEGLRGCRKWRVVLSDPIPRVDKYPVHIADLFDLRRGIATGAKNWFVIDDETRTKLRVPRDAILPVLPRSRELPQDGVVECGPDGAPAVRHRWLIDWDVPLDQVRAGHPEFYKYLMELRDAVGGRTLVARREPFYKQEVRPAPPLVASNMGKLSRLGGRPVRFFLNKSKATVLNNYIAMYPKKALRDAFQAAETTEARVHQALNQIDVSEFIRCGRRYAAGLYKLEPGDLGRVGISPELAAAFGIPTEIGGRAKLS